jgi:predicted amidophosphoribosyltransferase
MAGITAALARIAFPATCPGCGRPGEPVCERCAGAIRPPVPAPPPAGIDAWVALVRYDGVARELVARVKYRGRRHALDWLANGLAARIRGELLLPDLVTAVPTATAHIRERGFDHAQMLGTRVAVAIGCPYRRLLTHHGGPAQTDRPFAARRVGPVLAPRSAIAPGAGVLIVDDVATTGATLRAAAHALRLAGAAHVDAATLARTAPPGAP